MNSSLLKKLNITPANSILGLLFFAGMVLTVAEIEIYRKTFISYALPTSIWLLTGFLATPLLTSVLSVHYNMDKLYWQLFYNIVTWGGITTYAFMALNFYCSKAPTNTCKTPILATGQLAKGTTGCGEPYATIFFNGEEKQLMFDCGTPVDNYSEVEMKIQRGIFGFEVIKDKALIGKKKGAQSALNPVDYNIYFDSTSYRNTPLKSVQLGELNLPTGKIIAGDPLTSIYDADPFRTEAESGK